jgi:predicted NodU family carbamoyl transferase
VIRARRLHHDYAACRVEDDEIVCGVEEERLTRRKYSVGVNSLFNGSALRNSRSQWPAWLRPCRT